MTLTPQFHILVGEDGFVFCHFLQKENGCVAVLDGIRVVCALENVLYLTEILLKILFLSSDLSTWACYRRKINKEKITPLLRATRPSGFSFPFKVQVIFKYN